MRLDPYIFFTGNCAEAMNFYKEVFGGELKTMDREDGKGLMHADLSGGSIEFMACDGDRKSYDVCRISLSINGTDLGQATELFNKLADGGEVTQALSKESWGDTFGTVTDKFGIDWMFNIG